MTILIIWVCPKRCNDFSFSYRKCCALVGPSSTRYSARS